MIQKILEHIQNFSGVVSVEPMHVSPDNENELFVIITFDKNEYEERLTPDEIALRNYNATVRRGLINGNISMYDFIEKLREETDELEHEVKTMRKIDNEELADISSVCDSIALHYGIDLQKEKQLKMIYNETRP